MVAMPVAGTNRWDDLPDVKDMLPLVVKAGSVREILTHRTPDEKTLELCRELVRESPQTSQFHSYLVGCLLRLGKAEEAAQVYEESVTAFPEDVPLLAGYGRLLLGLGRLDEARVRLQQALELMPSSAQALAAFGVVLLREGDAKGAQEHLSASIALDDSSHGAAKYLGDAYRAMGSNDLAIAKYQRALEINPHWPAALTSLVETYLDRAQDGDARTALPLAWDLCEQSKHRDPKDLLLLARAYAAAERMDKARETVAAAQECAVDDEDRENIASFAASLEPQLQQ
jgi:tetratricopeptide (TPR) repeat protein